MSYLLGCLRVAGLAAAGVASGLAGVRVAGRFPPTAWDLACLILYGLGAMTALGAALSGLRATRTVECADAVETALFLADLPFHRRVRALEALRMVDPAHYAAAVGLVSLWRERDDS